MSIESVMPFNHLISLSKNEPQAKSILLGRGTGKGLPLGREEGKGEPAHGHQSSRKPPLGKVKSWLSCVTGHTVWTPCFFRLKFPSLRREQTFDILQESFSFMAAFTICSDFGAQKNKVWHCFHYFPIYFPSYYKILNTNTCARQYILVAYFICSNLYC